MVKLGSQHKHKQQTIVSFFRQTAVKLCCFVFLEDVWNNVLLLPRYHVALDLESRQPESGFIQNQASLEKGEHTFKGVLVSL